MTFNPSPVIGRPATQWREVGKESALLWRWRVKAFDVAINISYKDDTPDEEEDWNISETGTAQLYRVYQQYASDPVLNPIERVCGNSRFFYEGGIRSEYFEAPGDYWIRIGLLSSPFLWPDYPSCAPTPQYGVPGTPVRITENTHYVAFTSDVHIEGNGGRFRMDFGFDARHCPPPEDYPPPAPNVELIVNDIYGSYSFGYALAGIDKSEFWSGSVTLTPSDYWW